MSFILDMNSAYDNEIKTDVFGLPVLLLPATRESFSENPQSMKNFMYMKQRAGEK